ncbi:MAG: hypothetical protein ACYDAI_03775 [Trichloromonadaceae bacterium]
MVRFYDPIDQADQQQVEQVLRRGGIEYCLQAESDPGFGSSQILIAEEDIPQAETLLFRSRH